jgi:ketosteroid isomerase-like protein
MPGESTTPDLAEVVTGLFEAADRGDWDAMIGAYAPDAIWETDDGTSTWRARPGYGACWKSG